MTLHQRPPLPTLGAGFAALVLLALAVALPGHGVSAFLVRLVELVLAGGAAYLLDDAAARMTVVTPWSVWRRRAPALAGGLTVLATAWAVVLLVLRGQDFPLSSAALSGELLALGAMAVALAALLVWRGDPVPGSRVAPVLALIGITALLAEPLLRVSIFLSVEGGRDTSGWLRLAAVGTLSMAVILVASRDPAHRWRR